MNHKLPKDKKLTKDYLYEKYNLSKLGNEVVKYKLRFPQITHREIAILCDVHRSVVTRILNSAVAKQIIKEYNYNWIQQIIKAKNRAAYKLVGLIDDSNPSIAIRAVEDILQLDKLDLLQ